MAGRTPKPTKLKELLGNPGRRPLDKREPKPTGLATCPDYLSDVAKAEWARLAPTLEALGLLTELDQSCMISYCDAHAAWVDACAHIKALGAMLKSPNGYPVMNPYLAVKNQAEQTMDKARANLGLTPASRTRLAVEPPAPRPNAKSPSRKRHKTDEEEYFGAARPSTSVQ